MFPVQMQYLNCVQLLVILGITLFHDSVGALSNLFAYIILVLEERGVFLGWVITFRVESIESRLVFGILSTCLANISSLNFHFELVRGFLEDGHVFKTGFDVGNLLFSQLEFRFLLHKRFSIIYKTKDLYWSELSRCNQHKQNSTQQSIKFGTTIL